MNEMRLIVCNVPSYGGGVVSRWLYTLSVDVSILGAGLGSGHAKGNFTQAIDTDHLVLGATQRLERPV
jgi:hypothetical protein